jgi:hypothetical protein
MASRIVHVRHLLIRPPGRLDWILEISAIPGGRWLSKSDRSGIPRKLAARIRLYAAVASSARWRHACRSNDGQCRPMTPLKSALVQILDRSSKLKSRWMCHTMLLHHVKTNLAKLLANGLDISNFLLACACAAMADASTSIPPWLALPTQRITATSRSGFISLF